jgi:tryptophan synthase alpha chain
VDYLSGCREATHLPLTLGFGIRHRDDIGCRKGKADIAVIGTQTIGIIEKEGIDYVGDFIRGLC